jgi:hypothetical protein
MLDGKKVRDNGTGPHSFAEAKLDMETPTVLQNKTRMWEQRDKSP